MINQKINWKYIPVSNRELCMILSYNEVLITEVDISYVDDLSNIFRYTDWEYRTNRNGLETWDTSRVKNMSNMFTDSHFDWKWIENWDASNVNVFSFMFSWCEYFNGNVSNWNVNNDALFESMFEGCISFNKDLTKRNLKNNKDAKIYDMLLWCKNYNHPMFFWWPQIVHHPFWKCDEMLFREEGITNPKNYNVDMNKDNCYSGITHITVDDIETYWKKYKNWNKNQLYLWRMTHYHFCWLLRDYFPPKTTPHMTEHDVKYINYRNIK